MAFDDSLQSTTNGECLGKRVTKSRQFFIIARSAWGNFCNKSNSNSEAGTQASRLYTTITGLFINFFSFSHYQDISLIPTIPIPGSFKDSTHCHGNKGMEGEMSTCHPAENRVFLEVKSQLLCQDLARSIMGNVEFSRKEIWRGKFGEFKANLVSLFLSYCWYSFTLAPHWVPKCNWLFYSFGFFWWGVHHPVPKLITYGILFFLIKARP